MSAAVVAKVTGKAVILQGSESLPLSRNAELYSSDAVRTEAGAKVELRFSDGALFISGQLGVDGLDANFLVSVLSGGGGGLDPLYISGTETLDGRDLRQRRYPCGQLERQRCYLR